MINLSNVVLHSFTHSNFETITTIDLEFQIKKLLSTHLESDELKYRKLTDVPQRLLENYRELEESSAVTVLDMLPHWNKVQNEVLCYDTFS